MKEGEGMGGKEGRGTEIGCKINKLNKMKKKDVGNTQLYESCGFA